MAKYKNIAIKIALVGGIALLLTTQIGQQYADQLKPMIEIILQQ